jgi:hypothetical protein
MTFDPLGEKGIPVADQYRSWDDLMVDPIARAPEDPHTRSRIILMNGIEVESIMFSHQFHRHTDNPVLRGALSMSRRADQCQQKTINWLLPGDLTPLETTIGYEQVAVDLTAWMARHEPDPQLKMALDFALLEDFDHLYRYANLYELIAGRDAAELTKHLTDITPGRPTIFHHTDPLDVVRPHYETHSVHPLSRLHVMTIVAAEQQTMNFYMNHGPDFMEPVARRLYAEIAQVEEQHVTHYGSLIDPLDSWLCQLVYHELNEVYLYHSMYLQETDQRIRTLWERHRDMEIGQLHAACELLKTFEGRDPEEILPPSLPEVPVTFETNFEYVRQVLEATVDLRQDGYGYSDVDQMPADHRLFAYQEQVNGRSVPSNEVIVLNVANQDRDYRDEVGGPNPVIDLRDPVGAQGASS